MPNWIQNEKNEKVKCPSAWPGDTVVPIANCHFVLKVQCDKIHWKGVQEMRKHHQMSKRQHLLPVLSLSIPNLNSPVQ